MKSFMIGSFEARRRTPLAVHAMLIAVLLLFSACKGSSSETQPTSAVVKLSTVGTLPAGKKIGAIDITISLAPGVTLKSSANPPQPDPGVVTASGASADGSFLLANYTAPTGTLPGTVKIGLINANGFGTGEFATVSGDIAAGHNPKTADFTVKAVTISDTDGNPPPGLTAGIAVDIR